MVLEIITFGGAQLNKIADENNIGKLAEKSVKSRIKDIKKRVNSDKKIIADIVNKKEIDIEKINNIFYSDLKRFDGWIGKWGAEYDFNEISEILNPNEYPLSFIYLQKGAHLIKRGVMQKFVTELEQIKSILIPIVRESVTKHQYGVDEWKNKLLDILKRDADPTVSNMDYVLNGKTYINIYYILKCAKFANAHNSDMLITYKEFTRATCVLVNVLNDVPSFETVKKAIQNKDMNFFEEKFKEYYDKEYKRTLDGAKTELLKGDLGQAIGKAIVSEARSRNYKKEGFIDEEQLICMAIEWYSKELGVDWNELVNKDLDRGEVRRFSAESAEKISRILEQMKAKPKETVNNINRIIKEQLGGDFQVDERWMAQLLNQFTDVVKESVNKKLELVICQVYE